MKALLPIGGLVAACSGAPPPPHIAHESGDVPATCFPDEPAMTAIELGRRAWPLIEAGADHVGACTVVREEGWERGQLRLGDRIVAVVDFCGIDVRTPEIDAGVPRVGDLIDTVVGDASIFTLACGEIPAYEVTECWAERIVPDPDATEPAQRYVVDGMAERRSPEAALAYAQGKPIDRILFARGCE